MSGKTLAAAAAAAGMSERTARRWQHGALPSTAKAPRTWRTREDPFADVWASEVVPQLVADTAGRLQVLTLFKALCRRHPGRFRPGQLRTLQRRVREWRVQYGPDREAYFEQVAVPGREAAFDFTDASDLGVTIRGVPFPHLLFEWVLSYSKWTYVGLALSETFEALVSGLQGALWTLGAVPAVLRHDNLSAATHELKRSGGRQLTARFQQVLDHYGLRSSRIRPGKPHENGVAEQSHFRTKTAIEQALLLRGDRDFADESAYLRFGRTVVDGERNRPAAARLAEERALLRPLPAARVPEYTTFRCRVRKWSTIRIGNRTYSVPSRLIGHTVEARQHPSTVQVLYGGRVLGTMPRLRGARDHRIDYRHIIASLVRKPGAFARYRFREELFPSLTFRAAYDALGRTHGERADVEYVRLLHLAATTSERQVEATLRAKRDSTPATRASTPASRPRCVRRSRPSRGGAHPTAGPGALVRRAVDRRSARMTPASTQVTTLLTQFNLTTASEELVPRLTQAGHCCDALPVLVEVLEAEAEARRQRRIARLRRTSRLPPGKTFETLDTGRLPGPVVQQLKTLATGAFLETATNVLAFGLPGVGKSHALCAVGHALVEAGHSVLCVPAYALVQELLGAKRDLDLPRALRKLDLFEAILLDDLGYVQQSPDEAEVLFTRVLAERYERRSVMVTSNLIFSQWDRIFRDQMATAAAIDRLVHHSVVLEFDVPSFRTDPSRPTAPPSPPPAPRGRPPGPLLPRRRRPASS